MGLDRKFEQMTEAVDRLGIEWIGHRDAQNFTFLRKRQHLIPRGHLARHQTQHIATNTQHTKIRRERQTKLRRQKRGDALQVETRFGD